MDRFCLNIDIQNLSFFVFFYKGRIEKNNKSKYNTVMSIQYLKVEKESVNYVDNQTDF